MQFNLFDWIREGVKRSVIQGVSEAMESIGSPAGDEGAARLAPLLAMNDAAPPALAGGVKRKRLGRSLRDGEGGLITADQLLCHAVGDYIAQSDWMANTKTKRSIAALLHIAGYGIPFLFLRPSWIAMAVIVGSHFVIDRWRLARYVVFAKNLLAPKEARAAILAEGVTATGYPSNTPPFLSVWLLIIADNILHVLINGLALKYL